MAQDFRWEDVLRFITKTWVTDQDFENRDQLIEHLFRGIKLNNKVTRDQINQDCINCILKQYPELYYYPIDYNAKIRNQPDSLTSDQWFIDNSTKLEFTTSDTCSLNSILELENIPNQPKQK